jgi:hypothetical protein
LIMNAVSDAMAAGLNKKIDTGAWEKYKKNQGIDLDEI